MRHGRRNAHFLIFSQSFLKNSFIVYFYFCFFSLVRISDTAKPTSMTAIGHNCLNNSNASFMIYIVSFILQVQLLHLLLLILHRLLLRVVLHLLNLLHLRRDHLLRQGLRHRQIRQGLHLPFHLHHLLHRLL